MSEDRCYCSACADCREAIERHELAASPVPLLSPEGTGEAPTTAHERTKDAWGDLEQHFIDSAPAVAQRQWFGLAIDFWAAVDGELAELRTTVSRLTRERDEARQDTARLDWLNAEHERVDPVAALTVKLHYRRGGSAWANCMAPIRQAIDAARASRPPDQEPK